MGSTALSTSMDPACLQNLGDYTNIIYVCLLVVKDVVFHLAVMIRSSHLFQVYTFTAIACMRYTSRTAWRLCYSPPNYDGKLLSCFFLIRLPPPQKFTSYIFHLSSSLFSENLKEAAIYRRNPFHGCFSWDPVSLLLGAGDTKEVVSSLIVCQILHPSSRLPTLNQQCFHKSG